MSIAPVTGLRRAELEHSEYGRVAEIERRYAKLPADAVIVARIYLGVPLFGKTKTLARVPHDATEGRR